MIKKRLTRKIPAILSAFLITSLIFPYTAFAQSDAFFDVDPLTGQPNQPSNPLLIDTTTSGSANFGQIQNPSFVFENQVDTLGGGDSNVGSCLVSIVEESLINTLGGAVGGALGDLGLGELLGGATGAISGSLSGVFNDTLGSLGDSLGGALGGSLGDLGGTLGGLTGGLTDSLGGALGGSLGGITGGITDSLGGALGGSLGGITGGLAGGVLGGGTVPVNEDALQSINSAILALLQEIKGDTGAQVSKEIGDGATSLDSIAFCLANQAIEGILQGTIAWVNTGFNGNPAFVDDPEKFFGDIADYEFGLLLDELSGGLLCSHIDASIRINLVKDYNNQKYGSSSNKRRCTLSDQVENLEDFVNGDFSKGGWDAWIDYTSNPYSNYYSAQVQVREDLNSRISNSQSYAALELDWNNGYQSIRDSETGEITTPGSMIRSQVEKRLNTPIDRLTFADEFDELMNSMINDFVKISIGETIGGALDDIF